ncbi:MAG TPA: hypothetical protein VLG40_02560 [Candidatus Saccharimonas sp.]|nr:hypothetical protein [Candidatus Saccharimonas sp.]
MSNEGGIMTIKDEREQLQNYQDDLDTSGVDIVTHELTDQPSDYTRLPNKALKSELDKLAFTEEEYGGTAEQEDAREDIEDKDQGDLDNPD